MQLIELSSLEVLHWQQNICPSFWYSYGTREGNAQKELLQLEELKNEICWKLVLFNPMEEIRSGLFLNQSLLI